MKFVALCNTSLSKNTLSVVQNKMAEMQIQTLVYNL